MSNDVLAARIIAQIEAAFEGVRLDDGVSLREADVIDEHGTLAEREAARNLDELEDWKRVSEDLLGHYYWCLSFFDTKGLVFHLPAYMRFSLRYYETYDLNSIAWVTSVLCRTGDYVALLNEDQKQAIREFLHFMAYHAYERVDTDAVKALKEVWAIH